MGNSNKSKEAKPTQNDKSEHNGSENHNDGVETTTRKEPGKTNVTERKEKEKKKKEVKEKISKSRDKKKKADKKCYEGKISKMEVKERSTEIVFMSCSENEGSIAHTDAASDVESTIEKLKNILASEDNLNAGEKLKEICGDKDDDGSSTDSQEDNCGSTHNSNNKLHIDEIKENLRDDANAEQKAILKDDGNVSDQVAEVIQNNDNIQEEITEEIKEVIENIIQNVRDANEKEHEQATNEQHND